MSTISFSFSRAFSRVLAASALLVGCATTASPPPAPVAPTTPGVAADYYPLGEGWKWAYDLERRGADVPVLATRQVVERTADTAVVDGGGERISLHVGDEGISEQQDGRPGDFFLKNPVAVGTSWTVAGGSARIASVGTTVTVPAGTYANCVVVEILRGEPSRIERTTFASGVGPVAVDVELQDHGRFVPAVRARLRGLTRPGEDPLATTTP